VGAPRPAFTIAAVARKKTPEAKDWPRAQGVGTQYKKN
jgi:hypothetical protein